MSISSVKKLKVFYCYARKDQDLRDELEHHLSDLKRFYQLETWYDRQVNPGENWEQTIEDRLNQADIILLLVSPDFLASDYCYNREMQRALERHTRGEVKVIPIILRPVYWKNSPFNAIQLLPKDALPITSWPNRDGAFYDTVLGIERVIEELLRTRRTTDEWSKEGDDFLALKRYEEALVAYEQAIHLDPSYAAAYYGKGKTLLALKRYEEALVAYEQAAHLDPSYDPTYDGKNDSLAKFQFYKPGNHSNETKDPLNQQEEEHWRKIGRTYTKIDEQISTINPGEQHTIQEMQIQTPRNLPIPIDNEEMEHNKYREDSLVIRFAIGKFNDYLLWFLAVLEVFLTLRFLLRMFGANPENLFTGFVFTFTDILLAPFAGIISPISLHPNQAFEISTLIAQIIYFLFFFALRRFLRILISVPAEPD
jgi:tetratricopeptide (TPR) repeat protein